MADKSLAGCWSLASRDKAGYFVRDGILYRHEKILGQNFEQLCLPYCRRAQAIKLAHETFGGHLAAKKTKARLKLSFTWPTISADVQKACEVCHTCQKRSRVTVYDCVPISPIPRGEVVIDTWVMDCLGPLNPNVKVEYNYALVLCDTCSRYPVAFALHSLTATRSSATAEKQRVSCPRQLSLLWLHLCVWSNPKATTYVRQACCTAVHKTHFKMNRAFKVIQGHPYWCRQESRMVRCRNVQLMPTSFLKLRKIRQRENGKFVDFNDLTQV